MQWYSSLDLCHQNSAAKIAQNVQNYFVFGRYRNSNWTNAKVIDVKVSQTKTPPVKKYLKFDI